MLTLCAIGFHSTFLNRATIPMGIQVAIYKGKVKRKRIFLGAVAFIVRHSVATVNKPIMNRVRYPPRIEPAAAIISDIIAGFPVAICIEAETIKPIIEAIVRKIIGTMVAKISKQEKEFLFLKIPAKSFSPW